MAWKNTLLEASFRAVPFPVERIKDKAQNALAKHSYMRRKGADVENFGRSEHGINVNAFFWGDDYEGRLKAFVAALEVLDAGELIHPILGSMQCHAEEWEVEHEAERPDSAKVTVTFVEANADEPFFKRQLPQALAGLAGLQAMATLDALLTQFEGYMDVAQSYLDMVSGGASLLSDYWQRLTTPLFALKSSVMRLGGVGGVFAMPRVMMSDVLSLFGAVHSTQSGQFIIAPRVTDIAPMAGTAVIAAPPASGFTPLFTRQEVVTEVQGSFRAVGKVIDDVVGDAAIKPVPNSAVKNDQINPAAVTVNEVKNLFNVTLVVANAVCHAQAVATVFEWEVIDPTLSPPQVQDALNVARRALQASVLEVRAVYPYSQAIELSHALETLAWQLTHAARAVIHQRPALIEHDVMNDTNLHLLAHKLYKDYGRAYEIARLNPTLKDPNKITTGMVLHVYAS